MKNNLELDASRVFSRFSPFIREFIYKQGWNELRKVQIEAAKLVFETEDHILISSETASGKTEAALFPILSLMSEESPENFQVLYISPLKSLINDQFSRMEELLQESGLPVYRWHGDVSQNQKHQFLKNPKGLLQITPESLESMLCRRSNDIPRIFANLKFVILDEIHALMGSDRGYQILCQLQRISRLISYQPRRIALSATIGDATSALNWLKSGSDRPIQLIQIPSDQISWKLGLEHFFITEKSQTDGVDPASEFIYNATKHDKCVVFSNSREETEEICATLRQTAEKKGEEDRFFIHHGNLSAAIREEAEEVLKNDDRSVTACATVTLELGIDIGKLKRIINQGSPTSVSGFLQRLGRSGRRGQCPEMLMVFREEEALPNAPLYQLIPWDLLQAIAIVELYRTERWIEPAGEKKLPASLLFHQTLSCLAASGGLTAGKLASSVLSLAPFSHFSKEDYKNLLIHMLKSSYLERTEENEIIVGLRGERLLSSFKFFAVFKDSEDFTVRCGSEEIGTISSTPPVGEHFALAGRVWEVEEVDLSRRLVYCKRVDGKMKISWPGNSGFIHTKILEKIRQVLIGTEDYPFLMPKAKIRLEKARALARNTGLDKKSLLSLGGNSFVLFPWLGTRSFQAFKRAMQKLAPEIGISDIGSGGCYYLTFKGDHFSTEKMVSAIEMFLAKENFALQDLVFQTEYPIYDKYDALLPQELLCKSFAENRLDQNDLRKRLQAL